MRFAGEKRLTELRKCLGDTVKKVWEDKEPVLIKSHEKPIAAIVPLHMLDLIKEQKEVRAEQAIQEFKATDTKISSKFSFDDLEGHEETQSSPEIESDLLEMRVEQTKEESVDFYRNKCDMLQAELDLLKIKLESESATAVYGQTVLLHQTENMASNRFVVRQALKQNNQTLVKVNPATGAVGVVNPVIAQKLTK